MKKNKIVIFALIVILILIALSVSQNISNIREKNMVRQMLVNQVYSYLLQISTNLDGLFSNVEKNITSGEEIKSSLESIAFTFVKLGTLTEYNRYTIFKNLYSPSILGFDYIGGTLGIGGSITNGINIDGIMKDGIISENEIRYLRVLRDDIKTMLDKMVSVDDPPRVNQNLTIDQLSQVFKDFFSTWSDFNSNNCPIRMLQS